jgi:hypothetical protein
MLFVAAKLKPIGGFCQRQKRSRLRRARMRFTNPLQSIWIMTNLQAGEGAALFVMHSGSSAARESAADSNPNLPDGGGGGGRSRPSAPH